MVIQIRGANEHNLKNINIDIGSGLTAVTGISGSGKTSLAFDTLYHESRRRLLDVISTGNPNGWRHQLTPAQVDSITGLGPAVAVSQNLLNRNPLSTLASASGLFPFLRLLYATYGQRHCHKCGLALSVYNEDEIIGLLLKLAFQQPHQVFAPLLNDIKGSHRTLLKYLSDEFDPQKVQVDGNPFGYSNLDPHTGHTIEIHLGTIGTSSTSVQIRTIYQHASALGAQALIVRNEHTDITFASAPVCTSCGTWFRELEAKHFHMVCPFCNGQGCTQCSQTGSHPNAAEVRWNGLRLPKLLECTVHQFIEQFHYAKLPSSADRLRSEILHRLNALIRVGLGYINLNRPSPTLSRGESQRVRLAIALSSPLEDILHILDEPTIGQHPSDVIRFLPAFRELPGPVVYVEHDRVAAAQADQIIDLGPGAGNSGGKVIFNGTPADLWDMDTPSGNYFSLRKQVLIPHKRTSPEKYLSIKGAYLHNLKKIDVELPINRMTVITGVSGSGKSTLVEYVLVPSLLDTKPVGCNAIVGPKKKPVLVDQRPIGRNPRSNPATYTKFSDILRELFSDVTGLSASHFSFNRPDGACPTCKGMGALEVKMRYLSSVWIQCGECTGQRFNEMVLREKVTFGNQDLSIADFYLLTIQEVAAVLSEETRLTNRNFQIAQRILQALIDVGLGYLPLGQPSTSLSGGEAQRVKLTRYLGQSKLSDRLIVLDEPSTGLHPQDLHGLLIVFDRLVRAGTTLVIVEHNSDIIRAADWIIDLGPDAGPEGGDILYMGEPGGLIREYASKTGVALKNEHQIKFRTPDTVTKSEDSEYIKIQGARANNLKGIDVNIPKGKFTVVTGPSGSGKTSLVGNVLEAEARRRYLESMSMYERQGVREGPQAPVDSISGLGVTLTIKSGQAHQWSSLAQFTRRASVGRATELSHSLSVLLANLGECVCLNCGSKMERINKWTCPECGVTSEIAQARHFSSDNYASACVKCTGVGIRLMARPDKLIIHPDKPLCRGAMYSPGYWPQKYICQDTGFAQALGARYGFNPLTTPWNEMSDEAQKVFLYGASDPLQRTYQSKGTGKAVTVNSSWEGIYGGWLNEWDVHGTYTEQVPCPECAGAGLKPDILAVTLAGYNMHELSEMPLIELESVLESVVIPPEQPSNLHNVLNAARKRFRFLRKVSLGYLHLNRPTGTLSAGESQRLQLAGLLGSDLTSLTVLLDEPSRGMHPTELEALQEVLLELRDESNTVIIVEHDLSLIKAADHIIDLGPGAGNSGGEIVASGTPQEITESDTLTGKWIRKESWKELRVNPDPFAADSGNLFRVAGNSHRQPKGWMAIKGAKANNLKGETVKIPLGILVGFCGVSGSGKSTLLIDTLGRARVNKSHTTSFAYEPKEPGEYESIEGAPPRTILVDQTRKGIRSPATFLGLKKPMVNLYAASQDAHALGLDKKLLGRPCSSCKGRGINRIKMGFLPDLFEDCETCSGTGYIPEAWQVRLNGRSLPEINSMTLEEVHELFKDEEKIANPLALACEVGLGYLVWQQPAFTLSGGEAQRLKIVKELSRKTTKESLFILDEPTVGQHMQDVLRLIQVLNRLVDSGHTVFLIEHHTHVLSSCDWLIELGPEGGANGGRIVASGTPAQVAKTNSPTAPYLRKNIEAFG